MLRPARLHIWAGSLLFLSLGTLYLVDNLQPSPVSPLIFSSVASKFSSSFQSSCPSPDPLSPPPDTNIFEGGWVRSETPLIYNEITSIWGNAFKGCFVPAKPEELGLKGPREAQFSAETSPPGKDRIVDLMSYDWVPSSGASIRPWDLTEFVIRCLNSRVGAAIIGDSLQWHWFEVLKAMLEAPLEHGQPMAFYAFDQKLVHTMTLNPSHPFFISIFSRIPNIPAARLAQPFLYHYQDTWMIPYDIVDEFLVSDFGDEPGWHPDLSKGDKRLSPVWRDWVSGKVAETEGWEGEEDSLIILNTGPHWFAPTIQFRNDPLKILHVLQKSMEVYLPTVLDIPNIHFVFRSIAPGHENCHMYPAPLSHSRALWTPLPHDRARDDPKSDEYGWTHFPKLNRIAHDVINKMRLASIAKGEKPRASYFDIYALSLQRPDAKRVSPDGWSDCLHWCLPGVQWTWVQLFWHSMATIDGIELDVMMR